MVFNIKKYIDISTKSIVIAFVAFVVAMVVSKYIMDTYAGEDLKNELKWVCCVVIGLFSTVVSLVLGKYYNFSGTDDLLTGRFNETKK